eukprot:9836389-Lingulodinium_polyedra.AAC.1
MPRKTTLRSSVRADRAKLRLRLVAGVTHRAPLRRALLALTAQIHAAPQNASPGAPQRAAPLQRGP